MPTPVGTVWEPLTNVLNLRSKPTVKPYDYATEAHVAVNLTPLQWNVVWALVRGHTDPDVRELGNAIHDQVIAARPVT
jgi:hypothetical protein